MNYCFQHDMAYGDFKGLNRRIAADKVLREKVFNIAKNPEYDECQCGLVSMFSKFFDKKISGSVIKNENISNRQLAEELHKLVIRKFNKSKVHPPFIDNIWDADIADMQLISEFNRGFRFLSCVIDICSKYAWVIRVKDKMGITITNAFQNFLDESNHKPNKKWVDEVSEFYNKSMKS